MASLLMVILVPRLLPPGYIPLGLGLHKSLEMASTSLSQTLAGLWLDWTKKTADDVDDEYVAGEGLLRMFWAINILQFGCILLLWRFEAKRRASLERGFSAEEYEQLPMEGVGDESDHDSEDDLDLSHDSIPNRDQPTHAELEPAEGLKLAPRRRQQTSSAIAADENERRRGRYYLLASLGYICVVWLVFLASAWSRL